MIPFGLLLRFAPWLALGGVVLVAVLYVLGLRATNARQVVAIEQLGTRARELHALAEREREARAIADTNNALLATRMQRIEGRVSDSRATSRRLRTRDPDVREWSRAERPAAMSERLRDAYAAAFAAGEESTAADHVDAGVRTATAAGGRHERRDE